MASSVRRMNVPNVHRIHMASVDSTNTYAKKNLKTFSQSKITAISADDQYAGRGRGVREWKGSSKDIKITFTFPIPEGKIAHAYQLSPLASVVACRALQKHNINGQIKWPNDLIINDKFKFGGILCEMDSVDGIFWAQLGIGMNVNSDPDDFALSRPIWPMTSLKHENNNVEVALYDIEYDFCYEMGVALPIFWEQGFVPFQKEYEERSVLLGKNIKFTDGGVDIKGVVERIGLDGTLYLKQHGSNELRGFLCGEVSGIELVDGSKVESDA